VRPWIAVALAVAIAAIAPEFVRSALACFASIVLESVPYIAGSVLLVPVAGRFARPLTAYLGCGCGAGPAARSVPAALATAALFGPAIAIARLCAAAAVAKFSGEETHAAHGSELLDELRRLAPAAFLSAAVTPLTHAIALQNAPAALGFAAGAVLGTFASPCALGGVALAASLHAVAPAAGFGALCTTGIIDVRAFHRGDRHHARDPWAHIILAIACAIVAARTGAALVHPRIAPVLALVAVFSCISAWRARHSSAMATRAIPALVLAAVVIGAPAPTYRATETTLAGAFAGERVDFTGVAVYEPARSALVRYAITCCRADATPVVLALDRSTRSEQGRWLHAGGILEDGDGGLRLHVQQLVAVPPPSDPFIYR
jgi:hypothetical protein